MLRSASLLAALVVAVPAVAQTTTTTVQTTTVESDPPQQSAIRANDQAAAAITARQDMQTAVNADAQAQYQADLAAYDASMMRHDARADRQAEHYRHQQRAYADAMAAWRAQDYACRHGSSRACNAPSPDPAAYW